jgi:hypothetical protein
MANTTWRVDDSKKLDQLKLVYDYIKFHIVIIGDAFSVRGSIAFRSGLIIMITLYCISGISASLFMSHYVNYPWDTAFLSRFEIDAFSRKRRFLHHTLYWVGIVVGLLGIALGTGLLDWLNGLMITLAGYAAGLWATLQR